MTHTVTWDHTYCEHNAGWFTDCMPAGHVTCNEPAGDCRKHCRVSGYSSCDYGWSPCINECDGYDHPDPGVEHCVNGHILDIDECNAVLFLEEDPISNGPDDQPFTDGPIEVEWTGDGYQWSYA